MNKKIEPNNLSPNDSVCCVFVKKKQTKIGSFNVKIAAALFISLYTPHTVAPRTTLCEWDQIPNLNPLNFSTNELKING